MSAPSDPKSPAPESPTTARPLEMDDDDNEPGISLSNNDDTTPGNSSAVPKGSATATPAAKSATATTVEDAEPSPPPKPPRPMTEQQKSLQTLKDAFPTVDLPVIKAVLTASRGNIESAFHALLEMTDPDATEQDVLPTQPPRPALQDPASTESYGRLSPNSQLAADEEYARRLALQYESESAYEDRTAGYGARTSSRHGGPPYPPRPRPETGLKPNEMWDDDREHSFLDDDLPVIRENLRKGFVETQAKFNTWFTGIKKRIDDEFNNEDEDDDDQHHPNQRPGGPSSGIPGQGRPGGASGRGGFGNYGPGRPQGRRSGDYDADPQVLSDDFAGIQLHGDGTPMRNPNVFRPPPPSTSPRPGSDRKVSFRDTDEVIDVYNASPKVPAKDSTPSGGAKSSKWQPMSAVDPAPIADTDPFSLGDSEDEKDTVKTDKPAAAADAAKSTASASPEDAERLRKAAAEAMADSLVDDKPKAK